MIINIVKNIKVIHPKNVLMVKIGSFYHAYGRDAYILSYLFGYKLITVDGNTASCGFPLNSYLNNYDEIYQKAKIYINYKRRIDEINQFLVESVQDKDFKEILQELEIVIDARRKV